MTKSQLVQKLQDEETDTIDMLQRKLHETAKNYWEGKREGLRIAMKLIEKVYESGNW